MWLMLHLVTQRPGGTILVCDRDGEHANLHHTVGIGCGHYTAQVTINKCLTVARRYVTVRSIRLYMLVDERQ